MIQYQVIPGTEIEEACRAACMIVAWANDRVWFEFNGISLLARPGDTPRDLHHSWDRGQRRLAEQQAAVAALTDPIPLLREARQWVVVCADKGFPECNGLLRRIDASLKANETAHKPQGGTGWAGQS